MEIQVLNGAVKGNIWFMILNLVLFFQFLYTYYRYCYKKGFKVDFWHYNIFIYYILPYILLYPFAASVLNYVSTGKEIFVIDDYVNHAYIVSIIGYIFTYVGFYYFNFMGKKSYLFRINNTLNLKIAKVMQGIGNSGLIIWLITWGSVGILIGFYAVLILKYGFSLNIRSYILMDGTIRPFYNLIMVTIIPFILSVLLILFFDKKKKSSLFACIVIILIMATSGSRGSVLWPVLNSLIIVYIVQRKKVSISKIIMIGCLFLGLALVLESFRKSNVADEGILMRLTNSIIYGNNFSDLRDFAWILAYWDGNYFVGKSYLSALFSFLPRELSEIRQNYSISLLTNSLVGIDPSQHAGLRPGRFGESYFNFGIPGVMCMGFITGYIMRYTDYKIKESLISNNDFKYFYVFSLTILNYLVSYTFITSAFWKIYIIIFFLVFLYMIRELFKSKGLSRVSNLKS